MNRLELANRIKFVAELIEVLQKCGTHAEITKKIEEYQEELKDLNRRYLLLISK